MSFGLTVKLEDIQIFIKIKYLISNTVSYQGTSFQSMVLFFCYLVSPMDLLRLAKQKVEGHQQPQDRLPPQGQQQPQPPNDEVKVSWRSSIENIGWTVICYLSHLTLVTGLYLYYLLSISLAKEGTSDTESHKKKILSKFSDSETRDHITCRIVMLSYSSED